MQGPVECHGQTPPPLSSPQPSSLLTSANWNPAKSHKRGKKDLGKENRGILKCINTFFNLMRQVPSPLSEDEETEAKRDSSLSQITQL